MAKSFSAADWAKINKLVKADGAKYGLPASTPQSFLLGSFNIRKLAAVASKSAGAWSLFAHIVSRFDLIGIQEVQEDMEGLEHLLGLIGDGFDVVVSDTTGRFPGDEGLAERLAFVYRKNRVRRTEIASDITYDKTKVVDGLFENRTAIAAAFAKHVQDVAAWPAKAAAAKAAGKKRPAKPSIELPVFVTFIRTPHCVSFEVGWAGTKKPYEFLAVNVHLLYGEHPVERRQEFFALMNWLFSQAQTADDRYYPDMIMMGDCNLDLDKPEVDLPLITGMLKQLTTVKSSKKAADFSLPFLDVHPGKNAVFRTNARLDQTFDQVAIIRRDPRLGPAANAPAGSVANGFDYGVFDFADLFAQALHGKDLAALSAAERKALFEQFEFDFSDHMPIWVRLPRPT